MSEPAPPTCWRCDQPANVRWIDIRQLGDSGPRYIPGDMACSTAGCVDELGSTSPIAPTPGQMRHAAEAAWWLTQQALLEDR